MKLISILVLVLILAGGGGYYYFFILEPQQYVKAVLGLKKEFDENGKVLSKSDIGGQYDYEGALDILDVRKKFLKDAREKFLLLSPPYFDKGFREFREEYLNTLAGYELANADAEARAKFLVRFSGLGFLLETNPKPPFDEKTAYVRDLQAFFEKTFGSLKEAMNEAVKAKSPKINGEAEFEKLKSLWVEAWPALDLMLNFIRVQDPNAKLAGYSPKGSTRQQQEASDKMSKFGEALKKVLAVNTAYDILAYRFYEGFEEKISRPSEQVEKALEKLKEQYGR